MAKVNVSPERAEELWISVPYIDADMERDIRNCFTQYLFYTTIGKNKREYRCTSCGEVIEMGKMHPDAMYEELGRLKHNDQATCPCCDAPVILKAEGRFHNFRSIREIKEFVVFFNEEDRLYAMAFKASLEYTHNNVYCTARPELEIDPYSIYCFTKNEAAHWEAKFSYQTRRYDKWVLKKSCGEPFPGIMYQDAGYYLINYDAIFSSPLKYCGIDTYNPSLQSGLYTTTKVLKYLGEYVHRPSLEMVAKLMPGKGIINDLLYRKISHGRYLNWKAKSPDRFLKLSKQEANEFLRSNMKVSDLEQWKKDGRRQNFSEFIVLRDFFDQCYSDAETRCCEMGIAIKHLYHYLKKQSACLGSRTDTYMYWRDYIDAAEKCDYDLTVETVIFPKNLQERHDAAIDQVMHEADKKAAEEYQKKIYRKLKRTYEFELDGLSIVIPKSPHEIVNEGKALHHCVGGYATRHCQGKTTILFLRKDEEPETPYVTIEMNDRKMVQIHGYRNEVMPDGKRATSPMVTHKEFIDAWLRWIDAGSQRTKQGKPIIPVMEERSKTA